MITGRVFPGIDTPRRIGLTCALGAGVEAAMVWRFGWSKALPAYLYFGAVATVVGATDLATRRVPNRVVFPTYVVGPALLALASVTSNRWPALLRAGAAMALLVAFFLGLALVSRGGMGLGDCKWAGIVGLNLGWLGFSALLTGTILAFLAAAVFVVGRRVVGPLNSWMSVPFAPFMAGGALVAVFTLR